MGTVGIQTAQGPPEGAAISQLNAATRNGTRSSQLKKPKVQLHMQEC